MRKKGAIEADWIVSIGLFLVYLSFFFFYITPLTSEQPDVSDALLHNIEENLRANATWHVQRAPVLIRSNLSSTEPVIAPFFFNWANISFSDNTTFYLQENKLIFKEALRKGQNIKWVVSSGDSYPQPESLEDLSPTGNSVTIDGSRFRAEFDGLLTSAVHFEKQRISNLSLKLDGSAVSTESAKKEYNFTAFAAKYKMSSQTLNHTTFVVGGFPRLYSYASPKQVFEPHNLTVSATLQNYTSYFIDATYSGAINYTEKTCTSRFSNYIDFYDNLAGLTLITEDTANISFCTENASLELSATMALSNETRYDLLFHSGDYNSTLKYLYPYTVKTGLAENLSGISMSLIARLNESDYSSLKKAWNFPQSRDFSFELLNETSFPLVNYSPKSPGFVNIFTKQFDEVLLEKYGSKTKYRLRVKGW